MSRLSGFHIRTRAREDGGVEGGTLGAGGGVCTRGIGSFVRISALAFAAPRARTPEHARISRDGHERCSGGDGRASGAPTPSDAFAAWELGLEEDGRET